MERVDGWARHHCVAGAPEVDLTGAGLFPQVAEDVADVVDSLVVLTREV